MRVAERMVARAPRMPGPGTVPSDVGVGAVGGVVVSVEGVSVDVVVVVVGGAVVVVVWGGVVVVLVVGGVAIAKVEKPGVSATY